MSLSYREYREDNLISVDIETKDPLLLEKGTGVYRRDGYILGVTLCNGEISEYYPLRHTDTTPEEMDKNYTYLRHQLAGTSRKVFANGLYDLDWLVNGDKITVNGRYEDIQIAEPLLDEYRKSYSLNSLALDYLKVGKVYEKPTEYARQMQWPLSRKGTATHILWKMPYDVVKEYAEGDAMETWHVFKLQEEKLREQSLLEIYDLEMRMYPLLLQMKRTGVRIDEPRLLRVGMKLSDLRSDLQDELDDLAGFEINVNSGSQLEKLFKKHGLPITYGEPTDKMIMEGKFKGNPSFDKRVLQALRNPIAKKILDLRHISTLLNMFVHSYPEFLVDGRLHCQFNQLRSDEYGTVSGRFSSSNPNLQQVSGKDESEYLETDDPELQGQVIRKCFIPEDGCDWLKNDWSQIEYRLIAHYATGDGADVIRARYNEDPRTDYHDEMGQMTGLEDRKTVKTLNFGAAYGMGIDKMSKTYGWDLSEARSVYSRYHEKVPFVKETSRKVGDKAKRVGYIRTLLGRRARLWDSKKAYVMLNRLVQGSAADLMKKAMVDAYEAGVFNVLYPHLTVHDELDCSIPRSSEGHEAGQELKRIMETCVTLRVPIISESEYGPNWGELEKWQ